MRKDWLIYAAMWSVALVIVALLYLHEASERGASREREGRDAPVRLASDGPAQLPRREASFDEPPIERGAPRMHRGDRRHTGRSSFTGPAHAERAWRTETRGPIVGQAVVGDDGSIYVGSRDHHVYALSPEDGAIRWQRDLGDDVYATPALHTEPGGRTLLYVGSDADRFFILDAVSGEVLVDVRTDGDVDTGIAVAPDGVAYFGSGTDLWAITKDGEVEFRFRTGDKVFSSPAIDADGTIYFGSEDDRLYAIDRTGALRWAYRTGGDVDSGPAIGDDGTIYFGSDDRYVYALDRNGELRFRTNVDGYVRAPVGLGLDGTILVPVLGRRARLAALDPTTGEERWSFGVSGRFGNELGVGSSPLVDSAGDVYFGADDHYLYAIARDGGLRWVYETGANVVAPPILARDGLLVVGSDDHGLYAIRSGSAPSPAADAGGAPAASEPATEREPPP